LLSLFNSTIEKINTNAVIPSLKTYTNIDINSVITANLRRNILNMIEQLNKLYPKAIQEYSLINAPVLEKMFPKPFIDKHMESNIPNIFIIGDISGKVIGIITGGATGIAAGKKIINS